ncbi:MAG: site-specific integrase [Desulfamplus sp.]|nr:site-specific integrase [Desulfamplus sp.]
MAVTQRKNGVWVVIYQVDGKQVWEQCGKGLAGEKKAKERNEELKKTGTVREYVRQSPQVETPLFSQLAEEYLKAKSLELPKTSIDNLVYKLTGVILPEIGDLQAIRLTPDRMRDYIRKRLNTTVCKRVGVSNNRKMPIKNIDGTERKTSKSTIHRELSDIQAIMNRSVAEKFIPVNPLVNFKKPARDDEIILPPTQDEIQKIIEHAADHLKRVLTISFYTGLRPGASELFRLTWADVNLSSDLIHIISAKKGGAKDRLIPLHPEFKGSLEQWKTHDNPEPKQFLILWQGQRVKSVKTAFIAAKKRAGITRRLRLYDFRHAFATAMLKAGGDLKSTSEMLGHTRTDTTSRIYQHTDIDMHRYNISKLPSLQNDIAKDFAKEIESAKEIP